MVTDESNQADRYRPDEPTASAVRDECEKLRDWLAISTADADRLREERDNVCTGLSELETQAQAIQESTERRLAELVDSIVELRQSMGDKS